MYNIFKKLLPRSKKSHDSANIIAQAISQMNFITTRFLTPEKAIMFWETASPVSTAIDRISDEVKALDMVIRVNETGTIRVEKSAPILEFMKRPNDDMTQEGFLSALCSYFLITGEVYVVATGSMLNRPPAELIIVSPANVEVRLANDGFVFEINVNTVNGGREKYTRTDDFRFFNQDGSREIWQIKNFNPRQTGRGFSDLNSVSDEVDQYILTAAHNLGLLRSGIRSSGMFLTEDVLSDDQFARLKSEIDKFYSGVENAGKGMVISGGMEFKELSINPKDMDFENLTKRATTAVFNKYKVPLPLISPDNMTLSNQDSARLILYDNAVLPLAQMLFSELTIFLRPRFNLPDNEQLAPFTDNIPALKTRRNDEIKVRREIGVETINEIRGDLGLDPVEGGDSVFIQNNLVPAGTTPVSTGNTGHLDEDENNNKSTRGEFIKIMENQVDIKGNRSYTDSEIVGYADEEGLV